MNERLPSQVYKPIDFNREIDYVHRTCQEIDGDWRGKKWKDSDGNVFKIDCVDLTIAVN